MARWLLTRYTDCADPSREKEFNEWYTNIHLADMFENPAIVRATRYMNTDPNAGPGKYLAVYEVESEDIDKTFAEIKEHMSKKGKQGRYSELIVVVSMDTYKQISSLTR